MNGQTLNAEYDGYTQVPLYLNEGNVTFVEHTYDKATWKHLNQNPLFTSLWEKMWAKKKKKFLDYYLFKTWGAPYYKIKKTFKELPGSPEAQAAASKKPTTA